jgi:hypothetical protein
MMLATETLAVTLIRPSNYPQLSEKDIAEARERLARAFQVVWIEESRRLQNAGYE